ncbi:MAG TPA: DEAD/DEAH box helicase, partial [Candidatus Dormibacteraeota bacterium]|nr:DEAD/DEAH box helicase [Candidatus Dormibacteraeota bacterium]
PDAMTAALVRPGVAGVTAVRRLAPRLSGSYLAVQGPPGSGKTTVGAETVVDLVESGRQVGVTANSHKVIGHLLDTIAVKARERGVEVRIGQKPGTGEECTSEHARCLRTNDDVRIALQRGDVDVVGGTAWVWAREDLGDSIDVLVVDEAGQVSLANVVAVSAAARDLILLGDPQQLEQPLQGSHPQGADRSALAHLLDGHPTVPLELGVLLERTWRLHPDICAFTSEVFYDGDLQPAAGTERQRLEGAGVLDGTGLRFVPVRHEGDRNDSPDEAEAVASMIGRLLEDGEGWTDLDGQRRTLSPQDVLVITPYNAQVRELGSVLGAVRVGTVDKFQGQEAPVAVYSMATSSAEEAPRGMEFLYSLNRLNVATSRARCLAVVVASPELVRVRCSTPRQMRLANGLARFVELGSVRRPTTEPSAPAADEPLVMEDGQLAWTS